MITQTHAEVAAAVRSVIGTHTQAQDAGRTEEVAALYADEAVLEVPGGDPIVGRTAIREAFAGWAPTTPQKHLVGNTSISVDGDTVRAISDVVFFQRTDAGWTPLIVGRYDDAFALVDGAWQISRRSTTYQM
ncbi:nuclear transport factor 2 family protein [Gordonia sp. DT218]|uniref:nuclear transport factor 2 family protein n=1 Tax=Gordonia sp. DT218 TaxID=3416659 RepID=UPI003CEC1DDC